MNSRLIGAALILLAGLGLGLQLCALRRRQLATLRELETALGLLQSELETSVRPTAQLCAVLLARSCGETRAFFQTVEDSLPLLGEKCFEELWTAAAESCLGHLRREDRQSLERLGQSLGRYELSRQLQALTLCREELQRSWEQGCTALPEQNRLTVGFGLAGAAMLLILLL